MQGFFATSNTWSKPRLPFFPQCGSCGLYKKCESPKMAVAGHGKRKILIVGESPSQKEDKSGIPFAGNSSFALSEIMKKYNVRLTKNCWRAES